MIKIILNRNIKQEIGISNYSRTLRTSILKIDASVTTEHSPKSELIRIYYNIWIRNSEMSRKLYIKNEINDIL